MGHTRRFRLVTRNSLDGVVCAALLKEQNLIDRFLLVHPQELQSGRVSITEQDILANFPPHSNAHLVFNHRTDWADATADEEAPSRNVVHDADALSVARVIYDHYGGQVGFPRISEALIASVDQGNTAHFSRTEIINPKGWVLFNFLMDPKTRIGRFRRFRMSNHQLILLLVDLCRVQEIDQILTLPDFQERAEVYFKHQARFLEQIKRCATRHGRLVVVDLRQEATVWAGNRFMVYALFPACTLSVQVLLGGSRADTVFSIGKSIVNRGSKLDVGALSHTFGGGGHRNAGTCRVENAQADERLAQLVAAIQAAES